MISTCCNLLLASTVLIATTGPAAPSRIKVESSEGKLAVRAKVSEPSGWVDLATYVMETNSRPYLHPVRDASGRVVLTEDRPLDHPWQHGIFTGFHRVNGFNYWKEDEGKQRFVRLLDLKEAADHVSWRALVELVAPDGNVVLEEEDTITVYVPESPDAYLIDFDLLLRAKNQEVRFGKFFVGGLAARMPWDQANPRHTHLNSHGLRDRQCEQQRAAWCNVERPFGNKDEIFGIAVFDHPANPNHPPGWRADEQGLINPNVSALGDWTLPANQSQRFRYRLLVYRGSATREQLAKRFEHFGRASLTHEIYFPPPESLGGWRKLETAEAVREEGGMDPQKLGELKQWLLDSDKRSFAAAVIRNGHIVLEVERGNSAIKDSRRVASVSKAICATVLAIASEQSQGKMKFDDLAFHFIPSAQPLSDPRKQKITVKQLLNHTSGICPEATGAPNDGSWEYILGHTGDDRTAKLAFDPGTGCGYSSHALAHAALVCETVTGMPYDQFAIQALFKPLGVEHWWFQFYDGGEKYGRHPSHGLGMPARDLARIGYCMLRGGRWKDRQVIPKWFVDETASPTHEVKTPEMRWKLNPQIFSHGWELPARLTGEGGRSGSGIPTDARAKPGSGGQYIAFVPSLDLVITRQTGSSGDWQYEEYLRRACAAVVRPKTAKKGEAVISAPRTERFTKTETIPVGEFSVDLCRREDGAFGLGEIRRGTLPLRRADFLITWQVDGKFPVLERRDGLTIMLRDPASKLTFTPETRDCAGTRLAGFKMKFQTERGPIVETASWELGGSTRNLTYFDGYRGWHGPPEWLRADAVPSTNPKLTPSLLAGAGFQFEYGPDGALIHFHTTPGDRLRNASRGETLEFETSFHGPATVDRFIFVADGDSRLNLWTRAYEVAHAELRRAFGLPDPARAIFLQWPPFSRKGFSETAARCAEVTAREGFTGASINVIWDNADFRGGAKNMNVWDYTLCEGYGGDAGLKELMDECRKHDLRVVAWMPAGHLWSKSPVWQAHPEWVLLNARGEKFVNPAGGIWHGALDTGFHDYWRDRVVDVVRRFGVHGLWLDTHLSYAQQSRPPDHSARLAAIYADFAKAGVRHMLVEGDASAFGSYSIAIDDDWEKEGKKIPEPDLYYGATLAAGSMNPRLYLNHFRRYVAAGAPWIIDWDFLFSTKLKDPDIDSARREVRQVVRDYRRVKDRMVHRFAHADGSGYTWANDRDKTKVVWLLKDGQLPDGRKGQAGEVYVIEDK